MKRIINYSGGIFILLGIIIYWVSQQYSPLKFISYGPGFFPSIIGIIFISCGILEAFFQRTILREKPENISTIKTIIPKMAVLTIWSMSYVFLLNILGFLVVTFLGLIVFLYVAFSRVIYIPIIIGLIVTIFFQFVFGNLLGVQFPVGILTSLSKVLLWTPY